jgi:hypothetical protein
MDADPSKPLPNKLDEAFCLLVLKGESQSDAFRKTRPHSCKWKETAVHENASKLAAKVKPRIDWLKAQADVQSAKKAASAVGDLAARREMLWATILECRAGLRPYADASPDGDLLFDVNRDNLTFAIESIEQHVKLDPTGGGKDTVIRKMKVRDYLAYLQELNKLDGLYVEKREFSGPDGGPLQVAVFEFADTTEKD